MAFLGARSANGGSDHTQGTGGAEETAPPPSLPLPALPRAAWGRAALPPRIALRTRHVCCSARVAPGSRGSRLENIRYIDVQEKAPSRAAAQWPAPLHPAAVNPSAAARSSPAGLVPPAPLPPSRVVTGAGDLRPHRPPAPRAGWAPACWPGVIPAHGGSSEGARPGEGLLGSHSLPSPRI